MARFEYGSEVVCVDFHLHTRKDKEFTYTGNDNSFVSDYIEALTSKNIGVGIITNHNKFDLGEYKALRDKGRQHDISILPGVELTIKEGGNGVHTLIIFNPAEWICDGNDFINNFLTVAFAGIPNSENENTRCLYDLRHALEALERYEKDYFIIFAHAEQSMGLLNECKGGLITSLSQNDLFKSRVLGVQKMRNRDKIANLKQWIGYELAKVEGSDPKSISDVGKSGCQTYIKLGSNTFDAVKYALSDYKVRSSTADTKVSHSYIRSASFKGGKFDNKQLTFAHELNTLIGIRGSGKSSILEVLRWGLNINASIVDKSYKDDLVKNILGSGGQLSLIIADEHGQEYELRRILGENPSILDASGNDISISVQSIIRNPLYFGQKDLAFSKDGYEFELLNKLVGGRIATNETELDNHITTLCVLIGELLSLSKLPDLISELENKNRDLKHRMKIFEEKGIAAKLEKQTSYNSDLEKFAAVVVKTKEIAAGVINYFQTCGLDAVSIEGYTSKYNQELINNAHQIIVEFVRTMTNIQNLARELSGQSQQLEVLELTLSGEIEKLKEEFAEVKREINDDILDPDSFLKHKREHDKNISDIERHNKTLSSVDAIKASIKSEIRQRNEILQAIFSAYKNEIEKINSRQDALQLNIEFKGNKEQFLSDLKIAFKGTGVSESKYKALSESFSDFVSLIEDYFINNGSVIKGILSDGEFVKIGEKIEKNYKTLANIKCPDIVEIKYHGKPLKKHSMGQRASALILFILEQQQHDVIIIDQPEDDLDNQVVYTEFISTLKAKKPEIQFIFATHNANIPVLGDAERIIATQCIDETFNLSPGNIDTLESQMQIVEIMEGGFDAFKRRNAIYSSWSDNKSGKIKKK